MTGGGGTARACSVQGFPTAAPLSCAVVDLEPLWVSHADEMAALLDDASLHAFTGGAPASLAELRQRYRRQVAGRSPDGCQRWLNWVVRRREDEQAVGTVQATVTCGTTRATTPGDACGADGLVAQLAWVIASSHQGRGHAREAAEVMVAWLREQGVRGLLAHVHPEHQASQGVARALGLRATGTVLDGEVRWRS